VQQAIRATEIAAVIARRRRFTDLVDTEIAIHAVSAAG
jgi:hypothetical protein